MLVTIIIIVVVFIIGKFIYDKNKQSAKVTMEGGIRNKYSDLIKYLISGDSRSRIFQEKSHFISL